MNRCQVVLFQVGGQHYALDVMDVKEVVLPSRPETVVGQPAFVRGVVQIRGDYMPLVDLRVRFGAEQIGREAKVVVLRARSREVALLVDRVGEVTWLEPEDLRPPPVTSDVGAGSAVVHIAEVGERLVQVLAADALFRDDEWSAMKPLGAPLS